MNKQLCATVFSLSLYAVNAKADVTAGASTARDLVTTASVSGSILGSAIPTLNVFAGPLNEAQGTAPGGYNVDPSLLTASATTSGLLSATLNGGANVLVDELAASSTVDGSAGAKSAVGNGVITTASIGIGLASAGLNNILSVGISDDPATTEVLTSNSTVTGDYNSLNPTATSNFISSSTDIVISVLGVSINIPTLAAGVTTNIPISIIGLANVTGNIAITPDAITFSPPNASTAFATATSLSVVSNLNVSAFGGLTNLSVQSSIIVNQTAAQLLAVPEPGSATLTLLTGLTLLGTRRKR